MWGCWQCDDALRNSEHWIVDDDDLIFCSEECVALYEKEHPGARLPDEKEVPS